MLDMRLDNAETVELSMASKIEITQLASIIKGQGKVKVRSK